MPHGQKSEDEIREDAAEERPDAVSFKEQWTADPGEPCSPRDRSVGLSESPSRLSRTERTLQQWASTRNLLDQPSQPDPPFWKAFMLDWSSTLVVGLLVVSYWRVSNRLIDCTTSCLVSNSDTTKSPGHMDVVRHLDLRPTDNGWHDEWRILLLCRQYWVR